MIGFRVGFGYDVHRFAEDRQLVLGGVEVPHSHGLLGHSDADVLIHAVMDALLGAAALGDIGTLFPPSDERFRGADSAVLLGEVVALLAKHGWAVGNIDTVIIAEAPKMVGYVNKMRTNIAGICGVGVNCVSVKATTEEGLGLSGNGIGANCVCLLYRK
ncbi:MAG: 2-C-methyl-D-erythritol 2,4-cyclodiphosphate synthase [Oscillospiraceae bacterium]|nr:2-C-methyl-D-erythritol 2,4-cyclodiphosphate synthase [Oscillospiraceae bacterium]